MKPTYQLSQDYRHIVKKSGVEKDHNKKWLWMAWGCFGVEILMILGGVR